MMRKIFISLLAVASLGAAAQQIEKYEFTRNLRFNEGTVIHKGAVFISNFGTAELNPLNTEGKGYIAMLDGDSISILIPANGYLSAPKGMAVLRNHLFVADVGRVVVFDLKKPNDKPRVIALGADDLFANDVFALGDIVLVSITNTGRIYSIDATNIRKLGLAKVLGNVPGANGIIARDGKLYVASYDPNEKPTDDNVIYVCDLATKDLGFMPLIKDLPGGQYDGIAFSDDGTTLYFSSWNGQDKGNVFRYDFATGLYNKMSFGVKFSGPADISVHGGMIYIPDLPTSRLFRFKL